jgi:hypothetical protein
MSNAQTTIVGDVRALIGKSDSLEPSAWQSAPGRSRLDA